MFSIIWHYQHIGSSRLDLTKSAEKSYRTFLSQERDLLNKYNHVVSLWRRVSISILSDTFVLVLFLSEGLGTTQVKFHLFFFLLQTSTLSGDLRYADALRLLNTLEDASKG